MKLNVWYISKYVAHSGAASVGTRAFMIMRELKRMGHQPAIIASDSNNLISAPTFEGKVLKEEPDGVPFYWLRTRKYGPVQSIGRILSWLDFEWRLFRMDKSDLPRPDYIIVSSLTPLTILNGIWLRWRYKCRLICEIRDIWPLTIVEEGGYSKTNPFVIGLALIEKLGYRFSDAIVGTMPNLGQHVEEVIRKAPPVHCVPMGVGEEYIQAPEPLPEEYADKHIPKDKIIICHAGTIGRTNALDTFFESARRLQDQKDIHFLVVGRGDLADHYKSLTADLPNVSFAPAVPKTMVNSVLQRCDMVYFATFQSKVWRYGLSLNKLIDYMLSGRPVLASYSGYPSMINEAQCGSFVPAEDAEALCAEIKRYAEMAPAEREKIGARGREWILKNRSYRMLAQNYIEIFESIPTSDQTRT